MNQYRELLQKHQQEVNVLPIRYAFGEQQFREMMNAWGLDPEKDLDKIYRLGDAGGFYLRTDARLVCDTFCRLKEEREAAIAEDKTGMALSIRCSSASCPTTNTTIPRMWKKRWTHLGTHGSRSWQIKGSCMDSKWRRRRSQGRDNGMYCSCHTVWTERPVL